MDSQRSVTFSHCSHSVIRSSQQVTGSTLSGAQHSNWHLTSKWWLWLTGGDTHSEGEGVGVWTQLLHQLLLQGAHSFLVLLLRWEDLDRTDKQVFPEGEAQDIQVLATVAEGAGQGHKHWR